MRMCMCMHTPIDKSAAWNGRLHYYLPDHVMRHFLFFSSCMHVFSRKLCWGYDTLGRGRWVYVFLLKMKEGEKKKKLKRETLR